jgi:hypothetical protein
MGVTGQGPDMLTPPDAEQQVVFPPNFGARFWVTIDTEEDFAWDKPFSRVHHGLSSLARLPDCQAFFQSRGVAPLYLVDWPVINDPSAAALLRDAVVRGEAEVGAQLHPWVNPPFDEVVNARNSYTGNLPPQLQYAKMAALRDRITEVIGVAPLAYRAGRYGLGRETARMLGELGFRCDTSVRSGFDYRSGHGPDYRFRPLHPWWVGPDLLEAPLTTLFCGLVGERAYHRLMKSGGAAISAAARLGLVERIALTPEGIPVDRACAAIDRALELRLQLLNFSFHSPSLEPGHTPYVRTKADVYAFYGWWDQVLAHLERCGVRAATVAEVIAAAKPRAMGLPSAAAVR